MTGVNVGTRRLGTPREAAGFRGGKAREKAGYSSASLSQQLQTFGNFFQDILFLFFLLLFPVFPPLPYLFLSPSLLFPLPSFLLPSPSLPLTHSTHQPTIILNIFLHNL